MKNFVLLATTLTVLAVVGSALTGSVSGDESAVSKEASARPAKQCCLKKGTEVVVEKAKLNCCLKGQKAAAIADTKPCDGETCDADKKAAGKCKLCGKVKQVEAKKAEAPKCKLCSEKDCKEECKDCAEARQASGTAETKPGAGHGKGFGKGRGRGMGHGHAGDSAFQKDHTDFFFLIEHRDSIRRTVKNLPNGIETLTESDVDEVAGIIQEHVEAMYDRIENANPIRMRDPLFRELFANTDKIEMNVEHTDHGVLVTETSEDSYVVKLLQEHAKVVSLFIKNGYPELPKNHAVPQK